MWKKTALFIASMSLILNIVNLKVFAETTEERTQTFYFVNRDYQYEIIIFDIPELEGGILGNSVPSRERGRTSEELENTLFYSDISTESEYRNFYDNGNLPAGNIDLIFDDETFNRFWQENKGAQDLDEKYVFTISNYPMDCIIAVSAQDYYLIPLLRKGEAYGEFKNQAIYTLDEFHQLWKYQPVQLIVDGGVVECEVSPYVVAGNFCAPVTDLLNAMGYAVLRDLKTGTIVFVKETGQYYRIAKAPHITFISRSDTVNFEAGTIEDLTYDNVTYKRILLTTEEGIPFITLGENFLRFMNEVETQYKIEVQRETNQILLNSICYKGAPAVIKPE